MHTIREHVQYICMIITSILVGGLGGGAIAVYLEMRPPTITFDIIQAMYHVYGIILTTILIRLIAERLPEKW